jgi:hypothetical protein
MPCLIEEDSFNISTMLNLKQPMNALAKHALKP